MNTTLALLLITPLLSSSPAEPGSPSTHLSWAPPTSFQHIVRLRPDMDRGYAYLLAQLIEKHAKQQRVSPRRLVAIAMQESGIRQINRIEDGQPSDYGIFQFHHNTAKALGLDTKRLQYDVEYQIASAASLLRSKINLCRRKGMNKPWACYHSATPALAERYIAAVERYE